MLWWTHDSAKISAAALGAGLHDRCHQVLLSAVVAWEISIKRALRKLEVRDGLAVELVQGGVSELPISVAHAAAVEQLPPHHADPFDRMLVAQARARRRRPGLRRRVTAPVRRAGVLVEQTTTRRRESVRAGASRVDRVASISNRSAWPSC